MGRPQKKRRSLLEEEGEGEGGEGEGEVEGEEGEEAAAPLKINAAYAARFEHNQRRAELHRLQEKQKAGLLPGGNGGGVGEGEDEDEDDDEDDEDEDEDGEQVSAQLDQRIFETLAKIRKKDPSVYQPDVYFFGGQEEEEEEEEEEDQEKEGGKANGTAKLVSKKPVYLKDVLSQGLLEGVDKERREGEAQGSSAQRGRSYVEEQEDLRRAFLEAAEGLEDGEGEAGSLLKKRQGSRDVDQGGAEAEEQQEDEEEEEDANRHIAARLEEYFGKDEELDEGERFLKDYLASEGWKDRDRGRVPTYEEVVGAPPDVDEEEEELLRQDRFEADFNFRFEEGGAAQVAGHSRDMEDSVRKKPEARKQQRKAKQERAQSQDVTRREEVKRLKNLKRREVEERLARIRKVAGLAAGADGANDGKVADFGDLDEDFDPDEYDKKMKEAFGEGYYDAKDAELGAEEWEEEDAEEKPDFAAEDELLGLPKDFLGGGEERMGFAEVRERHRSKRHKSVDGDEAEEAEEEEEAAEQDGEEREDGGANGAAARDGGRKRKRGRLSLKDKLEFERRLEEYYKLDYEDMIGNLPTRFKYKDVKPNRFGLSTEEVLAAEDKELNQLISVKKLAPYRTQEWEVRGAKHLQAVPGPPRPGLTRKGTGRDVGKGAGLLGKQQKRKQRMQEWLDRRETAAAAEPRNGRHVEEEQGNGRVLQDEGHRQDVQEAQGEGQEGRSEGGEGGATGKKKPRRQEVMVPLAQVGRQLEGLTAAAKKNLKRKLKRQAESGEVGAALPLSRLKSYGEEALPAGQRSVKKKKKARAKETAVD